MKYLNFIYRNGTHSLRILNFVLCAMWLLLIVASLSGDLNLALPDNPRFNINWLGLLLVFSLTLTGLSFIVSGVEGVIFRFLSLVTGAGVQELIIERYFSTYPPLEVMTIFATMLAVWFLGGAFFICKDKDDKGDNISRNSETGHVS